MTPEREGDEKYYRGILTTTLIAGGLFFVFLAIVLLTSTESIQAGIMVGLIGAIMFVGGGILLIKKRNKGKV
jgi:ABC-type Fe3+-siderophore transport system permease subunit